MKVYTFLLFLVACCGQRKALNDFKGNFKKYVIVSLNTTSSIRNILDVSRSNAEYFINNTYSNNKLVKRISKMRSCNEKCFTKSTANRINKFQIPLRRRFLQIRQILNTIISSIENYERSARSIFHVCNPQNKNCLKESNEWLKSAHNFSSCAIHPNCQINNNVTNHLIRKGASCTTRQFSCKYGKCISSKMFCNGICDCADCSDEPPDCRRHCSEFRCAENFHCISYDKKCNGIDDCGDGTDEVGCQQISITRPPYRGRNCSIVEGKFLCRNMKCIELQKVCDGHNTCGDWSDEGVHCKVGQCSPRCGRLGGVCISRPKGSECVIECPPGTYETSKGCNLKPEAPLTSLVQILEDTPRLKKRYIARLKFLENKTIKMISKSLEGIVKCKKRRFSLLSAIVKTSNQTINYRFLNNHTDIEGTEDHKTNKTIPETKTNAKILETTPNATTSKLHGNENLTVPPQILAFNITSQPEKDGKKRDKDFAEVSDFSHASEYEENDKVTNGPTTASTDNTTPSPSNTVSDKPDRTTVEKITAGANSYVTEADGRNETNTRDLETTLNTTTSILHVNKSSETTSNNTIPMTFLSSKPGGHENNKAENFNFDGVSHGNNKTKEEADTIKTNKTTKQPSKQENQGSARIDDFDSGMKSNQSTEIKKEPTITPINETTPENSSNSTIPGVVKPENQGIKAGNDAYTDGRIGEDYDSEKKKKMNLRKTKGPRNKTNLETISKTTTLALQAVNVGAEDINMMGDERLGGIEEQETEDDKSNKTTKTNTTTQETTSDPTTLLSHMDKSTESKVSYEMTKTNKTTLVSISNPTTAATFLSSNPKKYENDKSNFGGGSHENNKTKEDQKPTRTNETSTLTTLQSPEGVNNGTDVPFSEWRNIEEPDTFTLKNSTTINAGGEAINVMGDGRLGGIEEQETEDDKSNKTKTTHETTSDPTTSVLHTNKSTATKESRKITKTNETSPITLNTTATTSISSMPGGQGKNYTDKYNFGGESNGNKNTEEEQSKTETTKTISMNTTTLTTLKSPEQVNSGAHDPFSEGRNIEKNGTKKEPDTSTPINSTTSLSTTIGITVPTLPDRLNTTTPIQSGINITISAHALTKTNPTNITTTHTNKLNTTAPSNINITTNPKNTSSLTTTNPSNINTTIVPTNTLTTTNPSNKNITTIPTDILTTPNPTIENISTTSINTLTTPNSTKETTKPQPLATTTILAATGPTIKPTVLALIGKITKKTVVHITRTKKRKTKRKHKKRHCKKRPHSRRCQRRRKKPGKGRRR